MRVFRITNEIVKQVFPVTIDIDNPAFLASLERLRVISDAMHEAENVGGLTGRIRKVTLAARAGAAFLRLFLIRPIDNRPPMSSRLQPSW
jgi:magnesium-protoporphyrin IX monomethyl ester (oxidative) cyclase